MLALAVTPEALYLILQVNDIREGERIYPKEGKDTMNRGLENKSSSIFSPQLRLLKERIKIHIISSGSLLEGISPATGQVALSQR